MGKRKVVDGVFTILAVARELATVFMFVALGLLAVEGTRLAGAYDTVVRLAIRAMIGH